MRKYCAVMFLFLISGSSLWSQNNYKVANIGFYNLENLFDTLDTPGKLDEEFLPTGAKLYNSDTYKKKLTNLAGVISRLGTKYSPDGIAILGVSEVENRKVLEDLIAQPALAERHFGIVHYESPDFRGIDVGLIYQPRYFKVLNSRPVEMPIYKEDSVKVRTRDILYVTGLFGEDTIHILVNHWPSRRGGETATEPLRIRAAAICRGIKDSLVRLNVNAKVIVMGDLNDDPSSKSMVSTLSAKGKTAKVGTNDMFNPMYTFYEKGIGTTAYRDAWSLFDQIVLSPGWLQLSDGGYHFYKANVFNEKDITQLTGKFKGYPLRTYSGDQFINGFSDHFPVFITLISKI
ncbi:MAG TPA: endonuclease/exonuclease/phosphatase family protein [Saprospiraceae bacterium]|nr:endonuclease/exonuclease/phosphatase family protein [Saprospiraceae bacterium]HQW55733.1 endonuclease/exonuclease/phosphatase family protein [Saprospiraceae bacterium]